MQIKTALQYLLIYVRMAITKKKKKEITSVGEDIGKGNPCTLLMEM